MSRNIAKKSSGKRGNMIDIGKPLSRSVNTFNDSGVSDSDSTYSSSSDDRSSASLSSVDSSVVARKQKPKYTVTDKKRGRPKKQQSGTMSDALLNGLYTNTNSEPKHQTHEQSIQDGTRKRGRSKKQKSVTTGEVSHALLNGLYWKTESEQAPEQSIQTDTTSVVNGEEGSKSSEPADRDVNESAGCDSSINNNISNRLISKRRESTSTRSDKNVQDRTVHRELNQDNTKTLHRGELDMAGTANGPVDSGAGNLGAQQNVLSAGATNIPRMYGQDMFTPAYFERMVQTVRLLNLPGRPERTVREDVIVWYAVARAWSENRRNLWPQTDAHLKWAPGTAQQRWFSVLAPTLRQLQSVVMGGRNDLFFALGYREPAPPVAAPPTPKRMSHKEDPRLSLERTTCANRATEGPDASRPRVINAGDVVSSTTAAAVASANVEASDSDASSTSSSAGSTTAGPVGPDNIPRRWRTSSNGILCYTGSVFDYCTNWVALMPIPRAGFTVLQDAFLATQAVLRTLNKEPVSWEAVGAVLRKSADVCKERWVIIVQNA